MPWANSSDGETIGRQQDEYAEDEYDDSGYDEADYEDQEDDYDEDGDQHDDADTEEPVGAGPRRSRRR